ncbi:MAG TPA: LEA type 2 family protein [Candidatus Methylomirabilis sp.]|nr:LEA type 2 family protein [Candidatus Methylomirabilis sp.]
MKRALVVLACALMLGACAAWKVREPLGVTIADITPLEMTLLEQRYAVKVRLLNPNDVELRFDGVVFDLEINGKPFAKGVSNQGGVVPRFGEALIDLQVVSGLQHLLRQIDQLGKGERAAFKYRISGRLHSLGALGSIPFNTSGEFSLPTSSSKPGT